VKTKPGSYCANCFYIVENVKLTQKATKNYVSPRRWSSDPKSDNSDIPSYAKLGHNWFLISMYANKFWWYLADLLLIRHSISCTKAYLKNKTNYYHLRIICKIDQNRLQTKQYSTRNFNDERVAFHSLTAFILRKAQLLSRMLKILILRTAASIF